MIKNEKIEESVGVDEIYDISYFNVVDPSYGEGSISGSESTGSAPDK